MRIMGNDEPFITVFSPNYNGERFISETIESILNQTYSNFEYIIIDDGSTDNSWDIIQQYAKKDGRIKPYRNEKNEEIVKTRNKGLRLSSPDSKYVAIIDSDDVAHPRRLEIQVEFLENNPEYGLVGSNKYLIDSQSKIIGFRRYPLTDQGIKKVITMFNPIPHSSVVLRKEVVNQSGYYNSKLPVCHDYDYWLRIGVNWKLRNLEYPLIKYRLSQNQVKSKHLKLTIQYTYLIQKKALQGLGYKDGLLLIKLYRILLMIFLLYPKGLYKLYRVIFTNKPTQFWYYYLSNFYSG